ncbi:MAG TPA: indolepyruvate oxidoreductase subunit beta family protein [Methylomirabilota bacterium]|nr:indolepyruvate oxidoreductase subunit beta family protein [Methylomirabilota bacterium]
MIVSLLIPAVGGQGGGVLSEWIVEAALLDGLAVHGTSIPGVAQRTGSTTYYVEVCTERTEGGEAAEPAFSLYPVPGALDVLLAPEFLEVGRMIELGFVSPARTAVIASTHRLYSIHEKIASGRAIYPQEALERAARGAARTLVAFDALALAREHGTEANAVLLGALAGSGALPVSEAAFRKAIEAKGVLVGANLAGFDVGLEVVRRGAAAAPAAARAASPAPAELAADVARLPEALRPVVSQALARLVDYQDAAYARRYLERLAPFVGPGEAGQELAATVARHLALWMTYEDAVRVAQLKTRAGRFERIRAETRARDGEIVVTDYLKPDLDELWGILPYRLVAPFARWAERRWPHGRPTVGQHVRTTTVSGFLRVWLLARLRRWRPISHRAHEEHARMEGWLAAVREAAGRDPALARELAQAAQLVKGYGDVRRRMTGLFDDLLRAAGEAAGREPGAATPVAAALARRFRLLVLQGPEGEAQARPLAERTLARLAAGDAAGALADLA